MADRPILFSGPMVRAILEGRKTQTRRVLKLPKKSFSGGPIYEHPKMGGWEATTLGGGGCFRFGKDGTKIPVPETVGIWHRTTGVAMNAPLQVGDRLWLRETWKLALSDHQCAGYQADMRYQCGKTIPEGPHKWRSSMFMPRWASRITLIVTDVRVQRLQDISGDDCVAEGLHPDSGAPMGVYNERRRKNVEDERRWNIGMKKQFFELWDSINGKRPGCDWQSNPWVAAYTFKPILKNIDQTEGGNGNG